MSKDEPRETASDASTEQAGSSGSTEQPRASVTVVDEPRASPDVALPIGTTGDGGVAVLRMRRDALEVGQLREVRDGQSIHGELVRLSAREGGPLYDVEVLHDAGATHRASAAPAGSEGSRDERGGPAQRPVRTRKGPPVVASEAYREGWEQIFGRRAGDKSAPN